MKLYEILGASYLDDTDKIKKKTLQLKKQYPKNSIEYNNIKKAYSVLGSYFKRMEYDKMLNNNQIAKKKTVPKQIIIDKPPNLQSLFDFRYPLNLLEIPKKSKSSFSSYSSIMQPDGNGRYKQVQYWNNNGNKTNNTIYYDTNGNKLN